MRKNRAKRLGRHKAFMNLKGNKLSPIVFEIN